MDVLTAVMHPLPPTAMLLLLALAWVTRDILPGIVLAPQILVGEYLSK